jgi:uncharacterized membrane protein YkoI
MRTVAALAGLRRLALSGLGVLLALSLAVAADQSSTPAVTAPPPAPAAGGTAVVELTREQAIALVQRRYHARVVRTVLVEQQGRRVYVFRLLSSGSHVWTVRIDAKTGVQVQP